MKEVVYTFTVRYGKGSIMGGGAHDSIIDAINDSIKNGLYYKGIGYNDVNITIDKVCKYCNGTGEKFISPRHGKKVCKHCKGIGVEEAMTGIKIEVIDNSTIITDSCNANISA